MGAVFVLLIGLATGAAIVLAGHVFQVAIVAGHNEERGLHANAMMSFAVFGKVHDHRVIEHRALPLGNLLEFFDDLDNLIHVTDAELLPRLPGR